MADTTEVEDLRAFRDTADGYWHHDLSDEVLASTMMFKWFQLNQRLRELWHTTGLEPPIMRIVEWLQKRLSDAQRRIVEGGGS